jgi:hypothetical protein
VAWRKGDFEAFDVAVGKLKRICQPPVAGWQERILSEIRGKEYLILISDL